MSAFLIWLTKSCVAPLPSACEATSSFEAGKAIPFRCVLEGNKVREAGFLADQRASS